MLGMNTWTLRIVSLVLVTALPSAAVAEGCKRVMSVSTPCVGTLLPLKVSASALKCLKTCKKEAEARAAHAKKISDAKLDASYKLLALEKGHSSKLGSLLDKALTKTPPTKPPFWESGVFIGGVGILLGVGISVLYERATSP
jgi:hypothetical protein